MQYRNKHFIQGNTQDSGLIRWPTGVGAVINRIFAVGYTLNRKNREDFGFVVVTGVVTKRTLFRDLAWIDVAFQNHFGACRYTQITDLAVDDLGFFSAQQAGKSVFRKRIRYRCYCTQGRCWICAQCDGDWKRLVGVLLHPVSVIECTTAV